MTMMLNTSTTPSASASAANTANASSAVAPAAQPADNVAAAAAPAAANGQPTAAANAANAAPAPANPQLFAQWLSQQAAGAQALAQAGDAAAAGQAEAPAQPNDAANASAPAASNGDGDDAKTAALPPDGALLAAMAMPLMPLPPAQIAQAVQAAQGNGQTGAKAAANDDASAQAPAVAALGQDARRAALAQPALAVLAQLPQQQAVQPTAGQAPGQTQGQTQAQAGAQPGQQPDDAAAVRVAVQAGATGGGDASQDARSDRGAAPAPVTPQAGIAMVSMPTAAQPAADTLTLAGPPTAWRQSLQEALGDRLHLQVGNNVEQAVIRLEPPQLGRIDIAIRHSAGSLEVNISATNGEVLRQLQTVSDNLRNDLSQRQFSEVAVTVTPTPKNGATPFSNDPQQQQGRGRQQGREQDEYEPGRALAEAGNPASAFSLGGRDRT